MQSINCTWIRVLWNRIIASGCNKLIVGNFTGKLSESESKKLKIISIGHENSISFGMKDILEKLSLEYSVPGSYR